MNGVSSAKTGKFYSAKLLAIRYSRKRGVPWNPWNPFWIGHWVGFGESLKCVKGGSSGFLLKFHSGTHGPFQELCRHAKGVAMGLRNFLIVGLERSLLRMFF